MNMRTQNRQSRFSTVIVLGFVALAFLILATQFDTVAPQDETEPGKWVELSFSLPAIGNVEEGSKWTYGRLVNLKYIGENNVSLEIRTAKDPIHRVICPKLPFHALAQVSSWMRPSDTSVSANDYTERMVAFTADEKGCVIAMVSLEPLPRNGKKIAKVYDVPIR